jgi:protein-S-isoprenylcysteine O-methyltransferase Ste14
MMEAKQELGLDGSPLGRKKAMRCGRLLFKSRGLLAMVPVAAAFLVPDGELMDEAVVWSVGAATLLLGMALRIWAQYHIGYRLSTPTTLTRSGPYRYVRNPIYIGNSVIVLGLVFSMEGLWLLPLAALWCGTLYSLVVRYEEGHLLRKHGAPYQAYLTEVPRWLPWGLVPALRNTFALSPRLRAALATEWHLLAVLLAPALKETLEHWALR